MICVFACIIALAFLLATPGLAGAPASHEITALPGWSGALPQKQYSGHVPIKVDEGIDVFAFYWYVAGPSAGAPVILWLQGGPGGSSIAGYWHEMGRFLVINW
jgi:carboxypeptidase C (cathepsin A)